MQKKRLLITGVSGLLGSNIAYCLKDHYDIYGLYHHHSISIPGIETRCVDLRFKLHTQSIIQQFNPDIIIHSAALANVDTCEEDPKLAHDINVQSTQNLIEIIHGSFAKFIYISTDLVYDGIKGNFAEDDPVGPRNNYAKTKLEGEKIALSHPDALVLRTNFFGWNYTKKQSLAEWVMQELREKRSVQGFNDVFFSSIYTFDLAQLIDRMINKDLRGVYNCVSNTSLSKYDFLVSIAKGAGLDSNLIKPVSIDASSLKANRSKNLSLDTSKISRDLGVVPPPIEEGIRHFLKGYQDNISMDIFGHRIQGRYYPFQDTIPYGRQCIDDDDIKSVVDVLRKGNLTQGPQIEAFERGLVEITGASYCAAVNSATSALHIACMAIGVKPGDEVITSTNSFVASSNCVVYCGAKPVFADIDATTYNMSPETLAKHITANTVAVIPVHFAGQSCDMEKIQAVVRRAEQQFGRKIYIIEDASHALGSIYQGYQIGSCQFSDMTVMSFHPVKHITTAEGGALLTKDQALHRKFCYLRSHGITNYPDELVQTNEAFENLTVDHKPLSRNPWYYEQQWLGYNYRISDLQCALGVSQLKKLPDFIKRRREIVEKYKKAFEGMRGVTLPLEALSCVSNFHLFVLRIDFEGIQKSRADVMNMLRHQGVLTQVHYIPIHTQPYYQKNLGTHWGDCPVAEAYYRQCLSIPLYPGMTDDDVNRVIDLLKDILKVG